MFNWLKSFFGKGKCVRDVLRDENSELTYTAAAQVQNRINEFFGFEE